MSRPEMVLSLIIPMHNEEKTIGDIINRSEKAAAKTGLRHEIIVVDDFSQDRSVENAKHRGAKLFGLKTHLGKGYALRAGFAKAEGDVIVTIDSDGSHRPEELPTLLSPILQDKADFVIGSRYLNQKNVNARKLNAFGVQLFNLMIKLLTGTVITDSQSGYRAMKRAVVKNQKLKSKEYEIESEMLVQTSRLGFRICEVPISFEQRTYGTSGVDPLLDGFKIFLSIIKAYMKG
jgi:glycosyltransferase involved in cell wall biosynthesis